MDQAPLGNLKARQLQAPETGFTPAPQIMRFFWEDVFEDLTNI